MTRFVMIGGFLGAGKTTVLLQLAQRYAAASKRVGIIANDLSEGLVDTATFRAHGLAVEEMAGGCFACKFDDLLAAAGRLQDGHRPDVLLAEPAGSCTDIVSRVVEPLKKLYADQFKVAPYVTLLDPQRALAALTGKGPAGFSAKVTYLYKMQQNEADAVAINKVDTLSGEQRDELADLVARNFPNADVMAVSARTGEGFDRLTGVLDGDRPAGKNPIASGEFDARLSDEGDADLGWVNATFAIRSREAIDADRLLLDLAGAIRDALTDAGAEPAHVKMILQTDGDVAIANLVSSDRPPELSQACDRQTTEATLILNARVEADPDLLRERIEAAIGRIKTEHRVDATLMHIDQLSADPTNPACRLPRNQTNA
jgi:G3E family GTPase